MRFNRLFNMKSYQKLKKKLKLVGTSVKTNKMGPLYTPVACSDSSMTSITSV